MRRELRELRDTIRKYIKERHACSSDEQYWGYTYVGWETITEYDLTRFTPTWGTPPMIPAEKKDKWRVIATGRIRKGTPYFPLSTKWKYQQAPRKYFADIFEVGGDLYLLLYSRRVGKIPYEEKTEEMYEDDRYGVHETYEKRYSGEVEDVVYEFALMKTDYPANRKEELLILLDYAFETENIVPIEVKESDVEKFLQGDIDSFFQTKDTEEKKRGLRF